MCFLTAEPCSWMHVSLKHAAIGFLIAIYMHVWISVNLYTSKKATVAKQLYSSNCETTAITIASCILIITLTGHSQLPGLISGMHSANNLVQDLVCNQLAS